MANRVNFPQLLIELAATTPPCRIDGLGVNPDTGTPRYATTASGGAWTTAQMAAVQAVINAHDPTKQSPDQVYAAAIAAGCQVVSTANAGTLNGTYAIDPATADELDQLVTGDLAGNFPSGIIPWPDQSGAVHNFAPADLVNLGKALELYVLALVAQKRGGMAPTQPVTIP